MKRCHANNIPIDVEKTQKRFLELCRENNISAAELCDMAGSHAYGRKDIKIRFPMDHVFRPCKLLEIPFEDVLVFREQEA